MYVKLANCQHWTQEVVESKSDASLYHRGMARPEVQGRRKISVLRVATNVGTE